MFSFHVFGRKVFYLRFKNTHGLLHVLHVFSCTRNICANSLTMPCHTPAPAHTPLRASTPLHVAPHPPSPPRPALFPSSSTVYYTVLIIRRRTAVAARSKKSSIPRAEKAHATRSCAVSAALTEKSSAQHGVRSALWLESARSKHLGRWGAAVSVNYAIDSCEVRRTASVEARISGDISFQWGCTWASP